MKIQIQKFRPGDDAELLQRGLRPCDEREAWKVAGMSGEAALVTSLANSDMAVSIRLDGNMAAILGVGGYFGDTILNSGDIFSKSATGGELSMVSPKYSAIPWLLAHDDFENPAVAVPMARIVRRFMDHWLTVFQRLENYADPDHAAALRLIQWMGFTLEPARPAGLLGHNLIYFWRVRECA